MSPPVPLEVVYARGVLAVFAIAAISFPLLFFVTAPYGGRHVSGRWGPTLPARWGWCLMELPAAIAFAWAFSQGAHRAEAAPRLFLCAFELHYLYRALVYPLRIRGAGARMPVFTVLLAVSFNLINGTVNGLAVGHIVAYGGDWLRDPRLWLGATLFATGAAAHLHSDAVLRRLRAPRQSGYRIPLGGLFRWVSSPNYMGEIVQWIGWAVATGSGAGLVFAVATIANLAPRARSNHRWYRKTFSDYPPQRKALVPGVW